MTEKNIKIITDHEYFQLVTNSKTKYDGRLKLSMKTHMITINMMALVTKYRERTFKDEYRGTIHIVPNEKYFV